MPIKHLGVGCYKSAGGCHRSEYRYCLTRKRNVVFVVFEALQMNTSKQNKTKQTLNPSEVKLDPTSPPISENPVLDSR